MQAASRQYVLTAAALAATGAFVAAPFASLLRQPSQPPVRHLETRLVDESVANIPINLFDDILNIPYNEVQGFNIGAASLFDTGTWWVPGSTNVWGIDPGDITHIAGIFGFFPFPTFDDGVGGWDYQIDGLLAAELPANASCDAATCAPIVPPDVISGNASEDRTIGLIDSLGGSNELGLFANWFHVPLSELASGYTFDEADDPGVIDPSGPADPTFGFPLEGGSTTNPFEGPTNLVDGQNQMPWDGTTYTLNLAQPFENFYDSLLQTPSTSGIDGTGVEIPTFESFIESLQSGLAGLVIDFDPVTEGSPVCPATCDIPEAFTIPALVEDIEKLDPNNTEIPEWLAGYAAGTVDEPTPSQVDEAVAMLQTGEYNLTPDQLATVDADLAQLNPELPQLYTNDAIITDPGYLAYTDATASTTTGATTDAVFDPVYGGGNYYAVPEDLWTLFTNNDWNWNALSEPGVVWSLIDPGLIVGDPSAFSASSTEPGAVAAGSDIDVNDVNNLGALLGLGEASAISTDISAVVSQVSSDLSAALSAELGTTLSTDLASILPTDLLSAF
jgi:hypothetical protein